MKKLLLLLTGIIVMTITISSCSSPESTTPSSGSVLDIETWNTHNGAKVLFVQAPELPMIDVDIAFSAGSARDGDHPGLAELTATVLDQGTAEMNADEIAERFESLGTRFSLNVDRDMTIVSLRSLTESNLLKPALTLFSDVLGQANFPDNAFKREQKNQLADIEEQSQNPGSVASNAFYNAVFGNHPYGHPVIGTKDSVSKISLDDIRHFYKNYYVSNNATIAIVGDLSIRNAKQIAEQVSDQLDKGQQASAIQIQSQLSKASTQQINFPVSQTHIRFGQTGINRNHPDYFPLLVGNHILGGDALVSRLFDEVREKRGLSYSVHSGFYPLAGNGPFVISLETKGEQADQALDVAKQTLNTFINDGPSDKELKRARQNIIGSFPMRIDSNSDIAANLIVIGFYDLPINYLDTFRDKIAAVTKEQIKTSFANHVQPEKMAIISVGPKKK